MLNRAVAMGHSPTELHSFGDSIRGKRKPEVGGKEAIAALAVIYAALRSAESRRTVTIKEVMED